MSKARPVAASLRSPALALSQQQPSPRPSLIPTSSGRADNLLPGSALRLNSIQPGARHSSAASPSKETDTCAGCSSSALQPSFATRKISQPHGQLDQEALGEEAVQGRLG